MSNYFDSDTQELLEVAPKVKDVIKGRLPEYLRLLYILSRATYRTEDNKTSYRIAVCNKSANVLTAVNSTYLVLDVNNNYRGFADSEYRACELAELIIRKPIPEFIIQR